MVGRVAAVARLRRRRRQKQKWSAVLRKHDTDGDGKLSLAEFERLAHEFGFDCDDNIDESEDVVAVSVSSMEVEDTNEESTSEGEESLSNEEISTNLIADNETDTEDEPSLSERDEPTTPEEEEREPSPTHETEIEPSSSSESHDDDNAEGEMLYGTVFIYGRRRSIRISPWIRDCFSRNGSLLRRSARILSARFL